MTTEPSRAYLHRINDRLMLEPIQIIAGLAAYQVGEGEPILFVPYPHGYTLQPTAHNPLASLLVGLGRQVLTFDPPGAFRSSRPARVDMPEMIAATQEVLDHLGVTGAIDAIGHSMGGLVALGWALAHPERVRRLVLVGSVAGYPSIARNKGIPWGLKKTSLDFWQFISSGLRINLGRASLADHKRILQIIYRHSYHQPGLAPVIPILDDDRHRPAPIRDRWPLAIRKIDYQPRLGEIQVPSLICAGAYDPQSPVACSQELVNGIPGAQLVIFEQSGHYPFLEEGPRFGQVLAGFFSSP